MASSEPDDSVAPTCEGCELEIPTKDRLMTIKRPTDPVRWGKLGGNVYHCYSLLGPKRYLSGSTPDCALPVVLYRIKQRMMKVQFDLLTESGEYHLILRNTSFKASSNFFEGELLSSTEEVGTIELTKQDRTRCIGYCSRKDPTTISLAREDPQALESDMLFVDSRLGIFGHLRGPYTVSFKESVRTLFSRDPVYVGQFQQDAQVTKTDAEAVLAILISYFHLGQGLFHERTGAG